MSVAVTGQEALAVSEDDLQNDPRWLLVRRILKTDSFHRAEQLRKILVYVSRMAILQPGQVVREYDIAFNALGRRQDFDPAQDNIVRVQFKNLRQRIDRYFLDEGKDEPLILTIPKGSYGPIFLPRTSPIVGESDAPQPASEPIASIAQLGRTETSLQHGRSWRRWGILALAVAALSGWSVIGFHAVRSRPAIAPAPGTKSINPALIQFFKRFEGVPVSVEVPDTSEMMIRMVSGAEITAEDYAGGDFPKKQIAQVKDPEVRNVLALLAERRNTTVGEARIAVDLIEALRQAGVASTLRYARDLHVRDFDQDNSILIGSSHSNPWLTLFADQMNFRLVGGPADEQYFLNASPLAGEQSKYVLYLKNQVDHENYAHIALIPNIHKNGSMLFIEGSDVESAEAGANFLLHGELTPQVEALLKQKDVKYFEIFFRGRHITGESDHSLQIVSVRTTR